MTVGADPAVEALRHESRRLVLDDDGRPVEAGAGHEVRATDDIGLHAAPQGGIEDAAPRVDRRCRRRSLVHGELGLEPGRGASQHQRPGERLDSEVGDGATVVAPVLRIEKLREILGIRIGVGACGQFDGEVVALAPIAHVGEAPLAQIAIARRELHDGLRFCPQPREDGVDQLRVEARQRQHPRMHCLIGDGRLEEAEGRADPGALRDDEGLQPELLGDPARMQRGRAAGGDEHAVVDVVAMVGRVDTRRVRHVLVDDLDDSGRPCDGIDRHAVGDMSGHGLPGARAVEHHAASRKPRRIELAEQQVRSL